jgi:hypothetical protein
MTTWPPMQSYRKIRCLRRRLSGHAGILKIPLHKVQPGMTIMEDVRTHLGTLLIARGFEVSPPFLERLRNLGSAILAEQVSVLAPQRPPKM